MSDERESEQQWNKHTLKLKVVVLFKLCGIFQYLEQACSSQ